MILSQKQIEEIAAAVTEDFNKFFFGTESEEVRMARATPIDQFARDYLGLQVSFARLSSDGSICGLTAYTDTEYIVEEKGVRRTLPLRCNQVLLAKPTEIRTPTSSRMAATGPMLPASQRRRRPCTLGSLAGIFLNSFSTR